MRFKYKLPKMPFGYQFHQFVHKQHVNDARTKPPERATASFPFNRHITPFARCRLFPSYPPFLLMKTEGAPDFLNTNISPVHDDTFLHFFGRERSEDSDEQAPEAESSRRNSRVTFNKAYASNTAARLFTYSIPQIRCMCSLQVVEGLHQFLVLN